MSVLEDYGEVLDDAYWEKWKKKEYAGWTGPVSWEDANKLKVEAMRVGVRHMEWVEEVCDKLKTGATLGCRGEGRWPWPTSGQNNKSAYEEGARMVDNLQTYINDGFVCGPFKD